MSRIYLLVLFALTSCASTSSSFQCDDYPKRKYRWDYQLHQYVGEASYGCQW